MHGAEIKCTMIATEKGAAAATRPAVSPRKHGILDEQAITGRRDDFKERALMVHADPNRRCQDEDHCGDLKHALHQPIGELVGEINDRPK
jgi:hypothetical protein